VIGRSWKIPIIIIFAMIAWVFFITALYFLLELIVASGIVLEIFAQLFFNDSSTLINSTALDEQIEGMSVGFEK